jgi:hypothetical protein
MKASFFCLLFVTLALLITAAPLAAHHGAASFDTDKEITLKATVKEWTWANPHCFLKFDAMDDTGTLRTWTVETGNPTDMSTRGWRRTSFKFGDHVTVTLQPFKDGSPVGRIRKVVFANGDTLGTTGALPETAPAPPAPQPEK